MADELMVLPASAREPDLLNLPDEHLAVVVRELGCVSFGMNYGAARIAKSVALRPVSELSPKERNAVIRIAKRFRRQLTRAGLAAVAQAGRTV